jgi:hypothetical protein
MKTGRTSTLLYEVDAAHVSDTIAHPPIAQPPAGYRPGPAAGPGRRAGMQVTRP